MDGVVESAFRVALVFGEFLSDVIRLSIALICGSSACTGEEFSPNGRYSIGSRQRSADLQQPYSSYSWRPSPAAIHLV